MIAPLTIQPEVNLGHFQLCRYTPWFLEDCLMLCGDFPFLDKYGKTSLEASLESTEWNQWLKDTNCLTRSLTLIALSLKFTIAVHFENILASVNWYKSDWFTPMVALVTRCFSSKHLEVNNKSGGNTAFDTKLNWVKTFKLDRRTRYKC